MSSKVALQLNALVGIASSMAATAMMWLVLTQPTEVASAVANHQYGRFVLAIAGQLGGWLHALLRFI
jgi:hypothetical protein